MQVPPSPPPTSSYASLTSPQEFDVDWASFYPHAWERGQALRRRYRHEAGLLYGEAPAMLMNILHPAQPREDGLVFVYMHGGAFSEGHPDFVDFIGERLLPEGVTFVSVGYRLAPTRFPDSASDVAQALAFLHRHLGPGKRRYCLAGHSAGASIAALLGVRPDLLFAAAFPAELVDSVVLISGIYDFYPPDPAHSFVEPARRAEASPVRYASSAPRKTLLVHGSPELNRKANPPDVFKTRAVMFEGALKAHAKHVERLELPDRDHVATGQALDDDRVLDRVLKLFE